MRRAAPFKPQLLKWIGNKQRFAAEIIAHFPRTFGTYHEPFLGSGGVLGTLAPERAVASDLLGPLMQIWQTLARDPDTLKRWYAERWREASAGDRVEGYERVKARYNAGPNGADLLFIARACYGGVVRFRQHDGYISTPCGAHNPIRPESFAERVDVWHPRVKDTQFIHGDFEAVMGAAGPGDVVYCDPPYSHTQSILYGSQSFSLERLFAAVARCKARAAHVALSIDGSKRSGNLLCEVPLPEHLFEREVMVSCGRSMLRRFKLRGATLEAEEVKDRLLLTY